MTIKSMDGYVKDQELSSKYPQYLDWKNVLLIFKNILSGAEEMTQSLKQLCISMRPELGVVAGACNAGVEEVEAGGLPALNG